jgi:hypothetical protein
MKYLFSEKNKCFVFYQVLTTDRVAMDQSGPWSKDHGASGGRTAWEALHQPDDFDERDRSHGGQVGFG